MKDIYSLEAAYLKMHPESGYLTEILNLTDFPNYIDYLPHGAIKRKINIMGYIPEIGISAYPYIAMSEEEYEDFVEETIKLTVNAFEKTDLSFSLVLYINIGFTKASCIVCFTR